MIKEERTSLFSPAVTAGGAAFLLALSGVLTIASSRSGAGVFDILLIKQLFFLFCGVLVMTGASMVPFKFYKKLSWIAGGAGVLLLMLLPWFGTRIHGMCGWFRLGFFSLQPSELMKAPFVLVLAILLSRRDFPGAKYFFLSALWTLLCLMPIVLQPDFGTAMIYFGVFILLYFAAGGALRWLLLPLAGGIAAILIFVWKYSYALQRLSGFWNPESDPLGSGWHVRQFELAIARGGFFGAKLGGALWSNNYLPFSYNDSAFATLSETLGFAGGIFTGVLLCVLAFSLLIFAGKSIGECERLFIVGTALLLVFQSLVHISVNLCMIPTTGLTMPFVSYGGSSLIGCFLLLGIALSAGKQQKEV